eukprot:364428-Chlamydomonas_euryale.AAC.13
MEGTGGWGAHLVEGDERLVRGGGATTNCGGTKMGGAHLVEGGERRDRLPAPVHKRERLRQQNLPARHAATANLQRAWKVAGSWTGMPGGRRKLPPCMSGCAGLGFKKPQQVGI